MSHLDTRLAGYHPEPLYFNENSLSPTPSDLKILSPNRATKEPIPETEGTERWGNELHTLPQGLPGRRHPATAVAQMAGFALAGAIFAAGHHVYYASLHLTPSDGTTRIGKHAVSHQAVTNFIGTVFIFLVKLCLSQTISKAFDQRLWHTVRRSAIKLGGLDALFSVLNDPMAFLHFEMVWRAKVATVLAFFAWTGAFGVIPVPGSLTVQSIETQTTEDVPVATVNLAQEPASGGAIYTSTPIRSYASPAPIVQTVASKTLLESAITTWPSPCGSDCSYNLTFFGPSFSCSAPSNNPIEARVPIWIVQPVLMGSTTDTLRVQYISDFQGNIQSETNCTSFNSTYNIAIQFQGSQQTVEVLDVGLGPSFGTNLTLIIDDPTFRPALAALKDAVSAALIGSIFQDTQTGLSITGRTLALNSALANNTLPTNPVFRTDTPQLIEQLLTNATISMISRSLWTTTAPARIVRTVDVFVYAPSVLWAGYGAAIGVTLLAIGVGLHAVLRNGGGGGKAFSLIMATTRNPELDAITDRALHQKEYRDTYMNLRFRYTTLPGREVDRLAFCEEE
ncbi:hypothetical protein FB451DRAFT_1274087 [Mycena latifolia]|nr:hypothetical protein FB451DRAFT_1274087 [Mycena latifolia]